MMDHILTSVDALAEMERRRIVSQHGEGYHSLHEGYGVLCEEVEEAEEALLLMESMLDRAWAQIRQDNATQAMQHVHRVEHFAQELAAEAVQVMAVCRRWRGENA